jgi:serine/threonine-protein kinase
VPPSEKRPEVPPELDAVVLRALAKNPSDRYQSAEEMDADLNAISKGMEISGITTEAATTVLAGAGLSAPTTISRAPTRITPPPRPVASVPPSGYYDLDSPTRRRPVWPWLLSLGLIAAVAIAFWIVFRQVTGNAPVAVPSVTQIREDLARNKITEKGLKPKSNLRRSSKVQAGYVIRQDPREGIKVARGSTVQIWVSSGTGEIRVGSVVGMSAYNAIAELNRLGFKVDPKQAHSASTKSGNVFRQKPLGNAKALKGSIVTIWVSQGPAQITLPDVRGYLYDTAYRQLVDKGFKVHPEPVDSSEPVDTVVGEDPPANSPQDPGTTITLSVSKGPQLQTVPDVTNDTVDVAKSTLVASGFKYHVSYTDTSDSTQDQFVYSQSPSGNGQAAPGTTVYLSVFNYVPTTTT